MEAWQENRLKSVSDEAIKFTSRFIFLAFLLNILCDHCVFCDKYKQFALKGGFNHGLKGMAGS
jgi:hypothetical protein